ncbi:MAG: hypothetical protein A2075_20285 [Geobacteraceae bacterium GWC2_58_44]|nr:MAG: hypothetical protein A2075_20285 [Geobacteraceae bacterium GWC2_58_44]HBG08311.1 hypothetical protein [Geobacter sp.]
MNKKIHDMAVFIEFLAGSGLAIFFHMVLHNEDAAYIVFGLGILLSLVTYLVREDVAKTKSDLLMQYQQVHVIPFALAQITDAECRLKAQDLVAGTLKSITQLQQGFIPLDEMDFYLEGARQSDQTTHQILAVDPLTSGWLSRGVLVNFYQSNLRAIERGIKITRIFITSREELCDGEVQKVLLAQHRDGVEVRLAFRDELPSTIDFSGSDVYGSLDFAVYDDRAATSVFAQTGKYYGRKTGQQAEIGKYLHLYQRLEHSAHAIVVEEDRIVLASEVLALAS